MAKNRNKPEFREAVLAKYGCKCAYCGYQLTMSNLNLDHLDPKKRGMDTPHGSDELDNMMPACTTCNSSKGNLSLEEWRVNISYCVQQLYTQSSTYRIAVKFGLLLPTNIPVTFYFETL